MNKESKHRPNWAKMHTLYVVLQGEFVLYHEVTGDPVHDKLHIAAPQLLKHEYKAGPWLTDWKKAEQLPKQLSLQNVIGDCKHAGKHCCRSIPEQNGDIFIRIGPEKFSPGRARLVISAPMPLAIMPGLTEPEGGTVIKVSKGPNDASYPEMPGVSTLIPILVYKWFGKDRPYLLGEGDKKWFSGGPSDDLQSLQIYASGPARETRKHAKHAFRKAAALLGADAELQFNEKHIKLAPATPPAGLSYAQVNWFYYQVVNREPSDPTLRLDYMDNLPEDGPENGMGGGPSGNCGPITGGGGGG